MAVTFVGRRATATSAFLSEGKPRVRKARTRWTAELVAEEIRAIKSSGVIPSQAYVVKHRPDLYGAAQRYCGGFRKALVAAGEDPIAIAASSRLAATTRKVKWTRATILTTLRERKHSGFPINVDAMKRDGLGGLLRAAKRGFGSYEKAVAEAGFSYADVRLQVPDWTKETVTESIGALLNGGHDLNVSSAQHLNGSLVTAAIRLFGSWDEALRQAGLDPSDIRLDVGTEAGKGRVFENLCNALFANIRPRWRLNLRFDANGGSLRPDGYDPLTDEWIDFKLAAWGMSVSSSIRKYKPHAKRLRFITLNGSRVSAPAVVFQSVFEFELEASGPVLRDIFKALHALEDEIVPGTSLDIWSTVWTKEKLIQFIRQLPSDASNALSVQRMHPREYSAVVKHFGGWYQGLDAAGLPANVIRRRRLAYTREDLEQFIEGRRADGDGLSVKAVTVTPSGNGLYQAANRLYGSWERALQASGVAHDSVNEFTLSKAAMLARLYKFIRATHAAGEPLNALYIRDHFKAEYKVACRLAGGWRHAVERCGIIYSRICVVAPPQRITKTDVDSYIRARHTAGLPLNTATVRRDNRPILTAACRAIYGSWKIAIEANGLSYRNVRLK